MLLICASLVIAIVVENLDMTYLCFLQLSWFFYVLTRILFYILSSFIRLYILLSLLILSNHFNLLFTSTFTLHHPSTPLPQYYKSYFYLLILILILIPVVLLYIHPLITDIYIYIIYYILYIIYYIYIIFYILYITYYIFYIICILCLYPPTYIYIIHHASYIIHHTILY